METFSVYNDDPVQSLSRCPFFHRLISAHYSDFIRVHLTSSVFFLILFRRTSISVGFRLCFVLAVPTFVCVAYVNTLHTLIKPYLSLLLCLTQIFSSPYYTIETVRYFSRVERSQIVKEKYIFLNQNLTLWLLIFVANIIYFCTAYISIHNVLFFLNFHLLKYVI